MASAGAHKEQSDSSRTCSICIEQFKAPKLLPCFHTFCQHCLEQYTSGTARNDEFSCPVCRYKVTLPDSGVNGFQTNFYIEADQLQKASKDAVCDVCSKTAVNRCRQCEQTLCDVCTSVHNSLSMTRKHSLIRLKKTSRDYPAISKPEFCSKHNGERFRFHCTRCEQAICRDCKLTAHEGHRTVDLEDVIEQGRSDLAKVKVELDACMTAFERKLKQLSDSKEKFSITAGTIEQKINTAADQMIEKINSLRKEKLKEIEGIRATEFSYLDRAETTTIQDKLFLGSHIDHVSRLLEDGCGADILNTLPEMRRRLKDMKDPSDSSDGTNVEKMNNPMLLSVSRSKRILKSSEMLQILMKVPVPEILSPNFEFQCLVAKGTIDFICPTGHNQAWVAIRGTVGRCSLILFNQSGAAVKRFEIHQDRYEAARTRGILSMMHVPIGDENVKSEEISALMGDIKLKQSPLKDMKNGNACEVYTMKGTVTVSTSREIEYELSPVPLVSAKSVFSPVDVCWGPGGEIVIADKGSNSLLVFRDSDSKLRSYEMPQEGTFSPCAVAFGADGKLWIGTVSGTVFILGRLEV
ncbi:tripartite motif-containing protein 45-like isoform X2 [Haliotis rufescens]|uniref:tripartite motif-containing protein 45-like isoform X1 n=1 Tax=Haliotis rufescens TaxID=6454 RepID=UPI00201EB0CE|nr:tripartite motif-containing protein 45-like isoform X1 [Haliotis rufescens]XP_048255684.1 tripartite motif-containing protein 45-like isoform X2 [Haliotis rufescens]